MYNVYDDEVAISRPQFSHFLPALLAPLASKLGGLAFRAVKGALAQPPAEEEETEEEGDPIGAEDASGTHSVLEDAALDGLVDVALDVDSDGRVESISFDGDGIELLAPGEKHAFADAVSTLFDTLFDSAVGSGLARDQQSYDGEFGHRFKLKKLKKFLKPKALLGAVSKLTTKLGPLTSMLGPYGAAISAGLGAVNKLAGTASDEAAVSRAIQPVSEALDALARSAFRSGR